MSVVDVGAAVSSGRAKGAGPPWVIIAPGFHRHGGMDQANLALAEFLADSDVSLHLVAHEVDSELAKRAGITVHLVPRPAGSFLLGEFRLGVIGRRVAARVTRESPGARVVVNGGNCDWPDINWVHCVHHAWPCADADAPLWFRAKNRLTKWNSRSREKNFVPRAQIVLANSERTHRDLIEHLGVESERIHRVYLGCEGSHGEIKQAERAVARVRLGLDPNRLVAVFVGALGHDNSKGLDTLWKAWKWLNASADWDVDLLVAGGGRRVEKWRRDVSSAGLDDQVRLLGFVRDMPELLAASDILISPTRYDAYGLGVQEAICRGIPALVSRRAGIAERYPSAFREMILSDPEDPVELGLKLLAWRANAQLWRENFAPFARELRSHGWSEMAREIVSISTSRRAAVS